MTKFAEVHCPNCGHKKLLVLKEDIIDLETKKKYNEVQCARVYTLFTVIIPNFASAANIDEAEKVRAVLIP